MLMAIHDRFFEGLSLTNIFDYLKRGGVVHSGFEFALDGQPDDNMFEGIVVENDKNVSLGRKELTFPNMETMIQEGIERCYEEGHLIGVQIESADAETWAFESHEVLEPSLAWDEFKDAVFDSPGEGWVINPILDGEIEGFSVITE